MMRHDSPPASWYEPADLLDDDDDDVSWGTPREPEPLTVRNGWATWTAEPDADD